MRPPSAEQSRRDRLVEQLPIVCVAVGIAIICVVNQRSGHDWGDDFSLYLRQGASIVDGNVDHVLDANRFTIDNSSWSTFSPYAYPWGWPVLIAPIYAVFGLDYGVIKVVQALLFAVFLVVWYGVTARRSTPRAALLQVLVIGLSVSYVGWTDTALSEFPYLCFLGLTWWWCDRCRTRNAFATGALWPLAVLGVLAAYTYNVRREGLALVATIGLVQAVDLGRAARASGSLVSAIRTAPWRRIAVPYAAGVGFVAVMQLALPSVLFQKYPEAGLKQLKPNAIWFRDILAEHIGLKDLGVNEWELLGSAGFAKFVFTWFVALAVIGLIASIVFRLERDAPLIGYGVAVCLIIGVQPFHEGRYLFSITPLMVYFAYQAIAIVGSRLTDRVEPVQLAAGAFIGLFVLTGATDLYRRTTNRLDSGNYIVWGPEDPAAQQMFEAVRTTTGADDVVSFFRARAMNLYADRKSVQLTTKEHLQQRADFYVMEKNSTYSQVLLSDLEAAELGFSKVWESDRYVIWQNLR